MMPKFKSYYCYTTNNRGFTMIELIIVLALIAILTTFAVPSFENMILNNKKTNVINSMISALQIASVDNLRNRASVTVCGGINGVCSSWADGITVFRDFNADQVLNGNDRILMSEVVEEDIEIKAKFSHLTYTGYTPNIGSHIIPFCDKRGSDFAKWILVLPSGRAWVTDQTVGDASC